MKYNYYFKIFFIILFFNNNCYCLVDSLVYKPEYYIANEINNKRIVMLGDFDHNNYASQHTIISVLNVWLNFILKYHSNEYLSLILENSKDDIERINEFIKNNDIKVILDSHINAEYLEDLEFYYDLANFSKRIDSLNNINKYQIFFNIKGFEEIGKEVPLKFYNMNRRELETYYVNIRDSLTANEINKYLNDNPLYKAIIFYGSAHLISKYVNKKTTVLKDDENKGYYLAYFLKRFFGETNVLTVNQLVNPGYPGTFLDSIKLNDTYIISKNINLPELNPDYYDSFIFKKSYNFISSHPVIYIYNNYVIKRLIEFLKNEDTKINNYSSILLKTNFSKIFFDSFLNNVDDLENWYKAKGSIESFNLINSNEFARCIFNFFYSDTLDLNRRIFLHQLGFILNDLNPKILPDTNLWWNEIWPRSLKHIIFFNSLGTYWFGETNEKEIAKEYLINFSGEKFRDAPLYYKWYRKKYYDYDF
jgi:hypothetical protein